MARILAVMVILFGLSTAALADVDTLECNTAAAIRIKYIATESSGEFCLLRETSAQELDLGGETFSVRFEGRHRRDGAAEDLVFMAEYLRKMVFTLDDMSGQTFTILPVVRKPYDPASDGNWRYTPLWEDFGDPILIEVGPPNEGREV
jgi:hypothetical protein